MNKYLATENLPKVVKKLIHLIMHTFSENPDFILSSQQYDNIQTKIKDLTKVLSEPALSDRDLKPLEAEIKALAEDNARLNEKKMEKQK